MLFHTKFGIQFAAKTWKMPPVHRNAVKVKNGGVMTCNNELLFNNYKRRLNDSDYFEYKNNSYQNKPRHAQALPRKRQLNARPFKRPSFMGWEKRDKKMEPFFAKRSAQRRRRSLF